MNTVFLYWGNRQLGFLRFMTIYSACRFNDAVTLILKRGDVKTARWGRASMDDIPQRDYMPFLHKLKNLTVEYVEDVFPDIPNVSEVHISDMLTWHLLAQRGGSVSDMDILYIKPLPPIDSDVELITYEGRGGTVFPIGLVRGRPNCFFKELSMLARQFKECNTHQCVGADLLKSYYYSKNHKVAIKKLDPKMIYPFLPKNKNTHVVKDAQRKTFLGTHKVPDECVGIHWYGGRNQQFNKRINHTNYMKVPCTLTKHIGMIWEGL